MKEKQIETQPVDNGIETRPVDNGTSSDEKKFSQREVNEIIRIRLERERAKQQPKEPTEAELMQQEAEQKQRELDARESRLTCKAYLMDSGYPSELLDVLDTSDPETFKDRALTVMGMIQAAKGPAPLADVSITDTVADIPDAFGRNMKHTPRQYWGSI